MREFRPKAPIFILTIPKERDIDAQRIPANEKIRAIASKFENTWVLDWEKYSTPTMEEQRVLMKFLKNGSHGNALGYSYEAKMCATYIDWIIRHNMDAFRNIQFILNDHTFVE